MTCRRSDLRLDAPHILLLTNIVKETRARILSKRWLAGYRQVNVLAFLGEPAVNALIHGK